MVYNIHEYSGIFTFYNIQSKSTFTRTNKFTQKSMIHKKIIQMNRITLFDTPDTHSFSQPTP